MAQGRHTASVQFLLGGQVGRSMGLGLATPSDQACLLPLKMSQRRRLRLRGRATQARGITGELGLEMSKPGFTLCESFSFLAP